MDQLGRYLVGCSFFLLAFCAFAQRTSGYRLITTMNQPAYVPGDTVFFQTLIVNKANKLDDKRRVAKISVIGEGGEALASTNILFERGLAVNQIRIPSGITTGSYDLSYTFHGPYFDQVKSSISIPILFGNELKANPKASGQIGMDYPKLSFIKKTEEVALITRQRTEMSLRLENVMEDMVGGLCLNLIYLDAFTNQDLSGIHQESAIELLVTPQARIILDGIAYYPGSDQVLPDSTLLIFYQQSKRQLYQTATLGNGQFRIELLDFFGYDRLLIGARINGKLVKDVPVQWSNVDLNEERKEFKATGSRKVEGYDSYKRNQQLINESYEFFLSEDSFSIPIIEVPPIRIQPDYSFDLTRFIIFDDMAELIKTIIRPLHYGEIGGKEIVRVKFIEETLTDQDPLYFIDGVATYSTDRFLSIPTESLVSMRIVSSPRTLMRFGTLGKHGIVIVETNQAASNQYSEHEIVPGLSQHKYPLTFSVKESADKPQFLINAKWIPRLDLQTLKSEPVALTIPDDAGQYILMISGYDQEVGFFSVRENLTVKP